MYDDPVMVMLAPCIRCGTMFASDPETVPSLWINIDTRSPVRPDGTNIEPGEPGTTREPLCQRCVPIIRAAMGQLVPLAKLFPRARFDRIAPAREANPGSGT